MWKKTNKQTTTEPGPGLTQIYGPGQTSVSLCALILSGHPKPKRKALRFIQRQLGLAKSSRNMFFPLKRDLFCRLSDSIGVHWGPLGSIGLHWAPLGSRIFSNSYWTGSPGTSCSLHEHSFGGGRFFWMNAGGTCKFCKAKPSRNKVLIGTVSIWFYLYLLQLWSKCFGIHFQSVWRVWKVQFGSSCGTQADGEGSWGCSASCRCAWVWDFRIGQVHLKDHKSSGNMWELLTTLLW